MAPFVRILPGSPGPLASFAYGPDMLAACLPDGRIALLSGRTGNPVVEPFGEGAIAVGLSVELGQVYSCGAEPVIRVWDAICGDPCGEIGIDGIPRVIACCADRRGLRLGLLDADGGLHVVHLETETVEHMGTAPGAFLLSWDPSADSLAALTGSPSNPRVSGPSERVFSHGGPAITAFDLQSRRGLAVTGDERGAIRFWKPYGALVGEWRHHEAPIRTVVFTPDFVVSASADGVLAGWDIGSLT